MQKGLATLEIIFVTVIIAVLVSCAVPNAARIIDTAALDYEYKRLYSDLRFVQAMGRSAQISATGTGKTNILSPADIGSKIILEITPEKNCYEISRDNKIIREPHYFFNGVTIFFGAKKGTRVITNFNLPSNQITADSEGKMINKNGKTLNGTLTLTSRFGKQRYIIFNTVGRFRASLTPPND